MLIENKKLYEALERALWCSYHTANFIDIHAIYEPDDDGGPHDGRYHAAVDLYGPGLTYHVYFTKNSENRVTIDSVDRWYMG